MKRVFIVPALSLLIATVAIAQYCVTPTFADPEAVGAQFIGQRFLPQALAPSYEVFREVDLATPTGPFDVPSVSGYRPVGLIAPQDGTVTIVDATSVQIPIPLQSGLPLRIRPQKLAPGGTLQTVVVVYR